MPAATASNGSLDDRLRAVLTSQLSGDIPGIAMRVASPRLTWSGAVGSVTLGGSRPLSAHASFRISSVTKPFTAVTVLRLVEQRRLRLDESISAYLEPRLVDRLSVIDGTSYGAQITIRQLLNHTSGVYDYAQDPSYTDAVAADPQRQWTRLEQIDFGLTHGAPYFPPGQGFHYSDTGYLLLGMIVEVVTGQPLHEAMRRLVIDPTHLPHTYTEQLEPTPAHAPERAHQYFGQIDTTELNPSFDLYGGGGLISTPDDLARFGHALFTARLLRTATLREMLTTSCLGSYGLGLQQARIDGETVWEHTGFFGTFLLYWPQSQLLITGSTNQANSDKITPAAAIVRLLRDTAGPTSRPVSPAPTPGPWR